MLLSHKNVTLNKGWSHSNRSQCAEHHSVLHYSTCERNQFVHVVFVIVILLLLLLTRSPEKGCSALNMRMGRSGMGIMMLRSREIYL